MLMWEISSGKPPFSNYENDYDLAMRIINGMRPKIVLGTPLEYEKLMKQCWDADITKRPDTNTFFNKLHELSYSYQNMIDESETDNISETNEINSSETNCTSSRLFTSKIHQFGNFPEPRNATEGMIFNK